MRYARKPLEMDVTKLSEEMAKTFGVKGSAYLCTFDSGEQKVMEMKDIEKDFIPKPARKSRAKPQLVEKPATEKAKAA